MKVEDLYALSNVGVWALPLHPLGKSSCSPRVNLSDNTSGVHNMCSRLANELPNVFLENATVSQWRLHSGQTRCDVHIQGSAW